MSHHIYRSDGFVLDSRSQGEANKIYYIFTRDLGLIVAIAQGVKYNQSKLKSHLQNFSRGSYAFVRGRYLWRLTSAENSEHIYSQLSQERPKLLVYIRLCTLLKRMVQGEEHNGEIFDVLDELYKYFLNHELDPALIEAVEYISVLKILFLLGYGKIDLPLNLYVPLSTESISTIKDHKRHIIKEINAKMRQSHL